MFTLAEHDVWILWLEFYCGAGPSGPSGPSGPAVWGLGFDRLDAEIVGSNPAEGMNVFLVFLCCVVLCR
jgi:hypothetical protein